MSTTLDRVQPKYNRRGNGPLSKGRFVRAERTKRSFVRDTERMIVTRRTILLIRYLAWPRTYEEIAKKFKIVKRSINRYLLTLEHLKVPVLEDEIYPENAETEHKAGIPVKTIRVDPDWDVVRWLKGLYPWK